MPQHRTTVSTVFQSFIDDAVANDVAPGFQCVIFDRDTILFNGVSGFVEVPSESDLAGKLFRPETLVWLASCSKICVSIVVLHIIEKGLTNSGFSIEDLDSHEALVEVLPEFKHGSGSLVTKIIEGYEDELGPDGKKIMKLRDVRGEVTLRMLLTHTSGHGYDWNHPLLAELYRPSDGSVPSLKMPFSTGNIRDLDAPLVIEPNTTYSYGNSVEWLGQWAARASGKTLRHLFKEIIFDPLGIPSSDADTWLSPSLALLPPSSAEAPAAVNVRLPQKGFTSVPLTLHTPEDQITYDGGCVLASLQAYAKVLQAVLNQDSRLLSDNVWQIAIKDDLEARGLRVPRPAWPAVMPDVSYGVDEFSKSTAENGVGVNLLQCQVATAPTLSGRPAGSFAWAGIFNTYFFVDPINGIGAIFGTQLSPFFEPRVVEMRDQLETLIYKTLFAA